MTTPVKVGLEFRINTATAENQRDPSLTVLSDGRVVVVWTDNNFPWTGSSGIRGKVLNADAVTAIADFVVSENSFGFVGGAFSANALGLADGRFLAGNSFYNDGLGPSGSYSLSSTFFTTTSPPTGVGSLIFNAQVVGGNDGSAGLDMAQLVGGNVAVVYYQQQIGEGDDDGRGVRLSVYDVAGVTVLAETVINSNTTGHQWQPSVAALATGGLVVAWQDDNSGNITTQTRNASGGAPVTVTIVDGGTESNPEVASFKDGGYVVAYDSTSAAGDTSGKGVRVHWESVTGVTNGSLTVNTTTSGDQTVPVVTTLPEGRFFVVWVDASNTEGTGGSGTALRGQLFKANVGGTAFEKDGSEILINTFTAADQIDPSVVTMADGRIMVSWTTSAGVLDPAAMGVSAQILDPRESGLYLTGISKQWVGTQFVDVMTGTEIRNVLSGAGGNDFIWGFGESDTLQGGAGIDYLDGGEGADTILGGDDGDNLQGGGGSDYLVGGAGHDFLFGLDGDDVLYGDAVVAEAGIDVMLGGAGNDALLGLAGSDVLYGDDGLDTLLGGAGVDWLFGGAGNDVLYGEAEQDFIYGGTGTDYIFTGDGVDYTYFEAGAGTDVLVDWASGQDILVFQGVAGITSMANLTIADGGGYVAITYGDNLLYVLGASAGQFDANVFIFV